jgi:hypothetical protein
MGVKVGVFPQIYLWKTITSFFETFGMRENENICFHLNKSTFILDGFMMDDQHSFDGRDSSLVSKISKTIHQCDDTLNQIIIRFPTGLNQLHPQLQTPSKIICIFFWVLNSEVITLRH